jgi:hypothetical protein
VSSHPYPDEADFGTLIRSIQADHAPIFRALQTELPRATDKMTADMATELAPVASRSCVYPGMVRTEKVMEAAAWLDLSNSESPEVIGTAFVAVSGTVGAHRPARQPR